MHEFKRINNNNPPHVNIQNRKANRAEFIKIPDLIEIEEALCAGRDGLNKYKDDFMGSLASYYDRNGFLTSPASGAEGAGQLGSIRNMISQRATKKAQTIQDAAESNWVGQVGGGINVSATLEDNIKGDSYRTMVFKDDKGNILLYRGSHSSFEGLKVGALVRIVGIVNKHTTYRGVKQTSLRQSRAVVMGT